MIEAKHTAGPWRVDYSTGEILGADRRIAYTQSGGIFHLGNAELIALAPELFTYAHEATKIITGLAGGGSENFSGQIGDMFKADLDFCAKKIRDRHEMMHGLLVKSKKENDALLKALKAILSHGELRNIEANPEAHFLGGKKPATKDVWTFPRHMLTDLEAAIAKAEGRS